MERWVHSFHPPPNPPHTPCRCKQWTNNFRLKKTTSWNFKWIEGFTLDSALLFPLFRSLSLSFFDLVHLSLSLFLDAPLYVYIYREYNCSPCSILSNTYVSVLQTQQIVRGLIGTQIGDQIIGECVLNRDLEKIDTLYTVQLYTESQQISLLPVPLSFY